MTENLSKDGVQSRQAVFVRCCLKEVFNMKKKLAIILAALMIGSFAACNTQNTQTETNTAKTVNVQDVNNTQETAVSENTSSHTNISKNTAAVLTENTQNSTVSDESSETSANNSGKLDTDGLFSDRDLEQTADTSNAVTITAKDDQTQTITEEGVYIITGSANNFTVKVEADKQSKIQLVLDGLNVTNSDFPVIYIVSADKCFITTTDTANSLSVTGTFKADSDTNTDAVIYSKDDLVFNGTGSLDIVSSSGNGISGKDDIKFTGGTFNIQSAKDSIEANDSILIYDGTFNITSAKDGLHSENNDDDSVGYIYILNGSFSVNAAGDAIQATTVCQIDGGTFSLTASECIESTYLQINGGSFDINATDDGINCSSKSNSLGTPTLEITGGNLNITMSGNDVDCIDSNGNIVVSGGTVNVTYPAQGPSEAFDCDGTATYTGGTIIINGTQVDSIPQSMMGGGRNGMNRNFGRW